VCSFTPANFRLRYDADETSAPQNNVALATEPAAPQTESTDTAMQSSSGPGYGEEPSMSYDPASFDTDFQGQEDHSNGAHEDYQNSESMSVQPQQERYNVNMKEDG
jgi:hypothetical protein